MIDNNIRSNCNKKGENANLCCFFLPLPTLFSQSFFRRHRAVNVWCRKMKRLNRNNDNRPIIITRLEKTFVTCNLSLFVSIIIMADDIYPTVVYTLKSILRGRLSCT